MKENKLNMNLILESNQRKKKDLFASNAHIKEIFGHLLMKIKKMQLNQDGI